MISFRIALSAFVLLASACAATRTLTRAEVEGRGNVAKKATFVPVDLGSGVVLQVRVVDERPPAAKRTVVLLHGIASSLETWDGWAAELAKSDRVIRLDLPGS